MSAMAERDAIVRKTVELILGTIEGTAYYGSEGAIVVTGDADGGTIIAIDLDGSTSEASLAEWSTGWTA